ncbi:GatB/YqeY domain-containing protein [Patescibacteria group bacterium]|nr:GatB/YqeY domain-containing protein [Patescibacteria group bacterium]MBU1029054.1 GatB/YqeY domain-containing protein [Patescibacteria group bacterium]
MNTFERIDKDFISSVKARDAFVVSALRMLRAALKNAEIDKRSKLEETEVLDIVGKEMKKIKDSLESFKLGGREDLSEKAEKEIKILEQYLPEQLSDQELSELVKSKILELGEVTPADFGRVMSEVMKVAKGKAEGNKISALVKEHLK